MNRVVKIAIALLASAGLVASASACGASNGSSDGSNADGVIKVVASVNQWGTVAQALGGKNASVESIINSTNVEAHDYEPTTADVAKLQKAQIIVVNGADYDSWAVKAAESTGATVVNAAEAGGVENGKNPHVWFSSQVRKATAKAIVEAYKQASADKSDAFEELYENWQSAENALAEKVADVKESANGLTYAATESVAQYMADDLGLTDATPTGYAQATSNEGEPTPADIKNFTDALASGEIKLLVVNTQEETDLTNKITDAAKSANVPTVELTEQMPDDFSSLTEWMESLVGEFEKRIS